MSSVIVHQSTFFKVYLLLQFLMDSFLTLHTESMIKGPKTNGEISLNFLLFNPFRAILNFSFNHYLVLKFLMDSFHTMHTPSIFQVQKTNGVIFFGFLAHLCSMPNRLLHSVCGVCGGSGVTFMFTSRLKFL